MTATFFGLVIVAYVLGAIPFGVLVARAHGVDILKVGSGNIGATNVNRVLGKGPGLAVWALDVLKSLAPTLAARFLLTAPQMGLDPQTQWFLVGLAAILGHCASPFLGFKGGKGISTALGAIIGVAPLVALICFGLFALVLSATRYMAVASTVGVFSVVVVAWLLPGNSPQLLPVFVLLALFVAYRHRANFKRLQEGTEPKFSFGSGGQRAEGGGSGGQSNAMESVADPQGRLRIDGNPQLPDPYEGRSQGYVYQAVEMADAILVQFLPEGHRLELYREPDRTRILFDGKDNGQLPPELSENVTRRLGLLAGFEPLKQSGQKGRITGTFDGKPFTLDAESFVCDDPVIFRITRVDLPSALLLPPSENP